MISRALLGILLLVTAFLTAGCALLPGASPPSELSEVQRHAATWAAKGPASYSMTVQRSCFCPPESSGPFTVVVRDGAVASVTFDGKPIAVGGLRGVPITIPAVFDLLAAQPKTAKVSIGWDEQLGFPLSFSVDPIPNAVDDEFAITVSDFVAQP
ncbi:MAG: DUF6174 domain-containing protein [Candidatus Limnocylindrales bacterium]